MKTGKLRYLGAGSSKRSSLAPDLPTIAEQGLPGYEASVWYGLLAPAGTAREIVNKLSVELARVMALPELLERFANLGMEPLTSNPEQFAGFIRSENVKWAKIVRNTGAKVE